MYCRRDMVCTAGVTMHIIEGEGRKVGGGGREKGGRKDCLKQRMLGVLVCKNVWGASKRCACVREYHARNARDNNIQTHKCQQAAHVPIHIYVHTCMSVMKGGDGVKIRWMVHERVPWAAERTKSAHPRSPQRQLHEGTEMSKAGSHRPVCMCG